MSAHRKFKDSLTHEEHDLKKYGIEEVVKMMLNVLGSCAKFESDVWLITC